MSSETVLIGGRQKITLGQNEYKAQGGEGTVYVSNGLAFKIYHDASKMIPEGKLLELKQIKTPNVLSPKDILYSPSSKKAVGFTMPYVDNTEYLTKLFSKGFKDNNNITPAMIVNVITEMQKQLQSLHGECIIVGDYNEMNFLVDSKFSIPYHIDVDSYQTKNFPCTAIMDSVRDRRLPFGKFDDMSDWFAWAIVTFQMYTGIHPFKGRHPDYKTTELDKRMINNVSVFNPDVKIPKNCQDFSAIPKNQLDWYKNVFMKGDRSIPPIAGSIGFVPGFGVVAVTGIGNFKVDLINDYGSRVISVQYFDGFPYTITDKAIYRKRDEVFTFTQPPSHIKLVNVMGHKPVIAIKQNGLVGFFDMNKTKLAEIAADDMMVCNGNLYTISRNGQLIENYFETIGKTLHLTHTVDNISSVYKMFDGVVIQDVFGKRRLSVPYQHNACASIMVPELEGYRIIDAKRIGHVCIIIGEKQGKYDRFVIFFDDTFSTYDVKINSDISYKSVNFTVKQNGMVVSIINDDTLELFMDNKRGTKEIPDCPVEIDMPLYDGIDKILFVNGDKVYIVKMGA